MTVEAFFDQVQSMYVSFSVVCAEAAASTSVLRSVYVGRDKE